MSTARGALGTAEQVSDPYLASLYDAVEARRAMNRHLGADSGAVEQSVTEDPPYDIEIPALWPIDLGRMLAEQGQAVPAEIKATLGDRTPVLIKHAITAFARPGQRPGGVWELGYKVTFDGAPDLITAALIPESTWIKAGGYKGMLSASVSGGGKARLHDTAVKTLNTIPGVSVDGFQVGVSASQEFSLNIDLQISVLSIQAGKVGAGGARWQLYRQDTPLDGSQYLAHTVLVPRATKRLAYRVESWVVRQARFFGIVGQRRWPGPETVQELRLD